MKYLLILLTATLFFSCKKKEPIPYKPVSKGNYLVLVVSDSLDYALEYVGHTDYIGDTCATLYIEFNTATLLYRVDLYAHQVDVISAFYLNPFTDLLAVTGFPSFSRYPGIFVDSIPGSSLKHSANPVALDTSKIVFMLGDHEWTEAWGHVSDLYLLKEYRLKYPQSKVSFMSLTNAAGEKKKYFFMCKKK